MPGFVDAKHTRTRSWLWRLAMPCAIALLTDPAAAGSERWGQSGEAPAIGEPIVAIVSLSDQRITVYDADGGTLHAPVSSGQKGRETPAGIFSVIQKDADHYSNLYSDGYMPHMQRITWSGLALHGGPLPGHPASHGCVRLPFDFAARLFDATRMGMRVVIAPRDVAPIEIAHRALFPAMPGNAALAAARAAEAEEAARKADQARLAAVAASREAARAGMPMRVAENLRLRAEAELAAAEAALASAVSPQEREQAEQAKATSIARIAELKAQWAAAKAELQPKLDAVAPARAAAVAAEATRVAAVEAAQALVRDLEPVSVFISRKTQRLYVRRAFQPIFEVPVTIVDGDRPIGTHVFTAMQWANDRSGMRWSVVSLRNAGPDGEAIETQGRASSPAEAAAADAAGAKLALDRIVIPQDAFDRISEMVSPRSSLIVSDEELSPETSQGTDFVVLLSGEPQGSIAVRRRPPAATVRYERPPYRSPYVR